MQSNGKKIRLNKRQIQFVVEMTEIQDTQEAVHKFAAIMVEERLNPSEMGKLIDKILERMSKR